MTIIIIIFFPNNSNNSDCVHTITSSGNVRVPVAYMLEHEKKSTHRVDRSLRFRVHLPLLIFPSTSSECVCVCFGFCVVSSVRAHANRQENRRMRTIKQRVIKCCVLDISHIHKHTTACERERPERAAVSERKGGRAVARETRNYSRIKRHRELQALLCCSFWHGKQDGFFKCSVS